MKVLIYQFAVQADYTENLDTIERAVAQAIDAGARLLLLPEGVISRNPAVPGATVAGAQHLDGPFVNRLRELSERSVAIVATVHIVAGDGRTSNLGVVCDAGEIVHVYDKLHLYDAFTARESDRIAPGSQPPGVFAIDGVRFGLLTCYDIRFPEPARALAVAGTDALLLPAAWARGPLKESHWHTMVTARALENTMYVLAAGECGVKHCGLSLAVDPLGVVLSSAAEDEAGIVAEISAARIEHARRVLPVLANRRYADPVLAEAPLS